MTGEPTTAAAPDASLGRMQQPAPGLVVVNATRLRDFRLCRRRFYLRSVLSIAGDDDLDIGDGVTQGLAVHAELYARHADFARHDDEVGVDPETASDSWVLARARNHRALCPADRAVYGGGEVDLRWFVARKALLLTGRADALWRYPDGTCEIRDYKSRGCPEALDDDDGALVYALLAAAQPERPPQVRVVFEALGGDEPRVATLDVDATVLRRARDRVYAFLDALRVEKRFDATPSPVACGTCPYRRLCPHTIVTGD